MQSCSQAERISALCCWSSPYSWAILQETQQETQQSSHRSLREGAVGGQGNSSSSRGQQQRRSTRGGSSSSRGDRSVGGNSLAGDRRVQRLQRPVLGELVQEADELQAIDESKEQDQTRGRIKGRRHVTTRPSTAASATRSDRRHARAPPTCVELQPWMSSGDAPAGPADPMPITSLVCHLSGAQEEEEEAGAGGRKQSTDGCSPAAPLCPLGVQASVTTAAARPEHRHCRVRLSPSAPAASPLGQRIRLLPQRLVVRVGDGRHACEGAQRREERSATRWGAGTEEDSAPQRIVIGAQSHTHAC